MIILSPCVFEPMAISTTRPPSHFERLTQKVGFMRDRAFYAAKRYREHPRFAELYPEYSFVSYWVARATVPLMEEAVRRAEAMPDDPVCGPLIAYLQQHIEEERDHDLWYARDIGVLGISSAELAARIPTPNVSAMIGSQYFWLTQHHPVAFMGYMASTEAYPPTTASVEQMIERSGLPPAAFDTLMLHARIDQVHKGDIVNALNALPLTEAHHNIIEMSAFQTFRYAALIMEDICRTVAAVETA